MRQNEAKLIELNSEISRKPENIELKYRKAICLMNLQNYPEAIYEFVVKDMPVTVAVDTRGQSINWISQVRDERN